MAELGEWLRKPCASCSKVVGTRLGEGVKVAHLTRASAEQSARLGTGTAWSRGLVAPGFTRARRCKCFLEAEERKPRQQGAVTVPGHQRRFKALVVVNHRGAASRRGAGLSRGDGSIDMQPGGGWMAKADLLRWANSLCWPLSQLLWKCSPSDPRILNPTYF